MAYHHTPNHTPTNPYFPAQQAAVTAAQQVLALLPAHSRVQEGPAFAVNPQAVDQLADIVVAFTSELVAGVINAGSERQAVQEDPLLFGALRNLFIDWSTSA